MRTFATLLVPLIVTGVMVYSIVDLITIDNSRVRHLPKITWVFVVILLSLIGSLLWFLVGREPLEKRRLGRYTETPYGTPASATVAPDDDTAFLGRLQREREQEERIRKLEERLKNLGDDDTAR